MKLLRLGGILVLVGLVIVVGLFTLLTPSDKPNSADPDDVISRISQADGKVDQLSFQKVTMEGNRVLVQTEFAGTADSAPRESADWHRLAEETAEMLYRDVAKNRGIEVRVYQDDELRSVAVAGI